MKIQLIFLSALFSLTEIFGIFCTDVKAEVLFSSDDEQCINHSEIRGEITQDTLNNIKKLLHKNSNDPECSDSLYVMHLDSVGGSVDVAMNIGRVIRDNNFYVYVREGHQCLSSCVLILAAGAQRIVGGNVGIHRPYFQDLSVTATLEEIKRIRAQETKKMADYLDEMDSSRKLADDMLAIEPEKIRYLSRQELQNYRLIGKPASLDDRDNALFAFMFGLNSGTYRKRAEASWNQCWKRYPQGLDVERELNLVNSEKFDDCRTSIILDINMEAARRKNQLASQNCNHLHKRSRSKMQEYLDCQRKIYTGND